MPARLLESLETVTHALTPIGVFRLEAMLEKFDPLLRIAQLVHVILNVLVCFFELKDYCRALLLLFCRPLVRYLKVADEVDNLAAHVCDQLSIVVLCLVVEAGLRVDGGPLIDSLQQGFNAFRSSLLGRADW